VCSARNVDRVRALGAASVLDYGAGDPLAAAVTHGPFRVIVDCVGTYPAGACRRLLGPGGRHVMVAGDSAGAFFQAFVPPFTSRILLGKPTGARLAPLVQAIAEGRLFVEIARRFPLAEAEAAHVLSQSGRVTGKMVLVP
jgi:NADPH:quinone reductase-like Zn-dependent oxidoreductase